MVFIMVTIAIIDVIGLTYDGTTLEKRGLGGSESAVILASRELANLGFSVTVINNCIDKEASEGIYDGVEYVDLSRIYTKSFDRTFDIVISSRTIIPFAPKHYWKDFNPNPELFDRIKSNAKLKVLWMHDTFCSGDPLVEELVLNNDIDEIFTLSDFHTSYISNCDHGRRRNFEVLKNRIFMTRNGVVKYFDEIDISKKDENLFVYNASVTKGMLPLVEKIWERIKQQVPDAKLKVVGGYYRFRENAAPDDQEKKWRELVADPKFKKLDIEFTGIIKQSEIAELLSRASLMIYPGAFPETFGISSLESLLYNTPLVTTRFGALEETAIQEACYLIDYAIEPNGLFPFIDNSIQVDRFVQLALFAINNKYLLQQKANYCNIIKDIVGWDSVMLQWKQHFCKKLGLFLSAEEYRKVSYINHRVQKLFGRRFTNKEQMTLPSKGSEQSIVIISPFYNAEDYISKCIHSVAQQDYSNYKHILIDDCSTDESFNVALKTIQSLPQEIQNKFILNKNTTRVGAVCNQVTALRSLSDEDIVMLLDGDDWLVNNNDIFQFYNSLYDGTAEFTYGSCWSIVDNIPLIAQNYPDAVKKQRKYREHRFNWNIPYTHLRTFKKFLINNVDDSEFKDEDGNWFKAGGDGSLFYSLIERADPDKIKVVHDIVYNYNDASPLNDYKVNGTEQTKNATYIINSKPIVKVDAPVRLPPTESQTTKKILIGIPTAKYIESQTFKAIYDLEVPEGYEVTFQYFYGYNIDQVRNLIADWVVRGFDYLFAVDYDISFQPDTLKKLLSHNKPIVTGIYRQRLEPQALEIYNMNLNKIPYNELRDKGVVEIGGCGFGCVLIKKEVFVDVGYPQFIYHHAVDHNNTFSEDLDFCVKARNKGFTIWVDTSILCDHHGTRVFQVT